MKKQFLTIVMAALLMIVGSKSSWAQDNQPTPPKKVIQIWDGKIPGSKHNQEIEEKAANQSNPGWITAVATPTLDYYPAQGDNKPAVIICPGGSYFGLSYMWEGIVQAQWFNKIGVSAFVLKYRLPKNATMENRSIGPLQDAQQAIRYVRSNAKKFQLDENKIGIIGFSAGGHLAATASTRFNEKVYKSELDVSARPDFSILVYPVISMQEGITEKGTREGLIGSDANQATVDLFSNEKQVSKDTPPTFVVHAINDKLVTYKNSILYIEALNNAGVECELHLYSRGDHGFQTKSANETQAFWHEDCERWLRMKELIK